MEVGLDEGGGAVDLGEEDGGEVLDELRSGLLVDVLHQNRQL